MTSATNFLSAVTVPQILNHHGIENKNGRCRCPIHGGKNRTAFSFNDEAFHCFACGANGGKLDLVEALGKVDRKKALRIIAQIAGVDDTGSQAGQLTVPIKRFPANGIDPEEQELADRLVKIEKLQIHYTERHQNLRWRKLPCTGESQRITFEMICDATLDDLADEHKTTKDKLRELKKRNRRSCRIG